MLPCLVPPTAAAWPVHVVRPAELDGLPQAAFLRAVGFGAAAGERPAVLSAAAGPAAVLGIGEDRSHIAFGDLARHLPEGIWRLEPGDYDPAAAMLGFCLGAYSYERFSKPGGGRVRLVDDGQAPAAVSLAETSWMVRDLINAPANVMGPAELAEAARAVGLEHGATVTLIKDKVLEHDYPALAAVAAGSDRPGRVVVLRWRGSKAAADAPLVSLCGKGVVFDTGGLDLKPSASMLRMKKDMGGAAILLGVARTLMQRDLPIRLALRLGCVENAVSGRAMRPGDVLRTRAGLTVEIGNTDAEGRLVLADLLAEACIERPAVLIDCATLTGAARVATGPDLPALFCNDDSWAGALLAAGVAVHDPLWRMPLWDGYDSWLASPIADLNNVSSKPFAGAVVAALFLRRFIAPGVAWAHVDVYAWNDAARAARPEGGEAQAMRAIIAGIEARLGFSGGNGPVTSLA